MSNVTFNSDRSRLHLPERAALIEQIGTAETLAEVVAARDALRTWLSKHPEDHGMRDGGEELSLLEEHLRAHAPAA